MRLFNRMRILRHALLITTLSLAIGIQAQFDGPAPLAWRWSQPTRLSPVGTPLVNGDTVYVAMGQRFFALNKDSGNQKWRFPVGAPTDGNFKWMPVLAHNTVACFSDNQAVYGVDAATGVLKWRHALPLAVLCPPVGAAKYVVVALSDNTLEALDADTGADVWGSSLKLDQGITGSLASFEDTVIYFNTASELVCINVPTQKLLWKKQFSIVNLKTKPVVFGDTIYVNSGTFVAAVNVASGRGLWEADAGSTLIFDPAPSANVIMAVTQDGKLVSFDLRGQKIFQSPLDIGTSPVAAPASVGNLFVVPSGNGALSLVNPRSGEISWNFVIPPMDKAPRNQAPLKNFVTAAGPATLAGKTLIVLGKDGSLLAFDSDQGVDLTPPKVSMVDPNPGDQVSGQPPLTFAFTIADETSGVKPKSVSIELDGRLVEFEETKDHFYLVRVSTSGNVRPLSDGRHVLTVNASDWMGNLAKTSFSIQIDNTLRPKSIKNVPGNQPGGGGGDSGGGGRTGRGGGGGGGGG